MIKKIIISACLLLSLVSFAQEGTSSPYSFYGIGDVRFKGTLESRAMAGLAIEQDSIHINLQNPASYASLKMTNFTMGGTYNSTTMKSGSKSENARRTTLDYLAVGLPLGKFGVGFGLIPYSSVGYKIESLATAVSPNNKRFEGSGGLNKVFLGFGYKITPKFSVGVDAHYNFGKIQTKGLEFVSDVIGASEINTATLSGVNFRFGAMYQAKINKKMSLFSSLSFSPESTLVSQNQREISNLIDTPVVQEDKRDLKLPGKLSLGAGIGEARKWLLGAEVSMQNVGSLGNYYNVANNVTYEKGAKYSLGGYFIPNYNSFSNYAKRITYRGGLKFEKTGLVVNSESINDMGLSLGAGLPISGSFSNVNFGLELGKKGTTKAGLVQENYVNFSVSFSFNDKWFRKNVIY
jgi:long-subunit fatty acid transport protein